MTKPRIDVLFPADESAARVSARAGPGWTSGLSWA